MAKVAREGASRAVAGRGRGSGGWTGERRTSSNARLSSTRASAIQAETATEGAWIDDQLDDGVTAWRWTYL